MSAVRDFLGRPGDPLECKTLGDLHIHWYPTDAKEGDPCLCGKRRKGPDENEDDS